MEERLKNINVGAYTTSKTAYEILESLTDEELRDIFEGTLEALLQEGRI